MSDLTKSTTVARINNVDIVVIENGDEKYVAVKPICEALGVAHQSQIERLKTDPILGPTVTISVTVGADGKQREMVTIPFKFVFGWLFKIDVRNVGDKAAAIMIKYQLACYEALYERFTMYELYEKEKSRRVSAASKELEARRDLMKGYRKLITERKKLLHEALDFTMEKFFEEKRQTAMSFPDHT